jgi:hypothetical protein
MDMTFAVHLLNHGRNFFMSYLPGFIRQGPFQAVVEQALRNWQYIRNSIPYYRFNVKGGRRVSRMGAIIGSSRMKFHRISGFPIAQVWADPSVHGVVGGRRKEFRLLPEHLYQLSAIFSPCVVLIFRNPCHKDILAISITGISPKGRAG